MNILNDILEKEGDNRGSVYLYCLEDSWKAFGYSAFYLSLPKIRNYHPIHD